MIRTHWLAGWAWLALGAHAAPAHQDPPPPPVPADAEAPGVQVLTQGPIHEAFANPVLFDPKPGPVVPKAPPAVIDEAPPDQRPEGNNVQWIPGYWAWDDERNDFLWVSGVWRDLPPGRQWVPGYWQPAEGGVRWVPGYWGSASDQDAAPQYLPEPPASPEAGPSGAPPTPDSTWSPGSWVWQDNQYAWRPGFWVQPQPSWMWTPASYSWTPNGYLYNQGYWDYPLANRGLPFAPAYFGNGIANRPGFAYSPTTALLGSSLLTSLFVRPNQGSYYFGDYYGANNFQRGIYPAYAFHNSRYGYDPLYAHAASQNVNNPRWSQDLHDVYAYRRDHPEARPARTFSEQRALAARPAAGGGGLAALAANNLAMARPLNQINQGENALRLRRVDPARRQEIARQSAQVHQFREDRLRRESEAAKVPRAANEGPRRLEAARSPIAAAPHRGANPNPGREAARAAAPPNAPAHPPVDRGVARPTPGAAPVRHEPGPAVRPPAQHPNAGAAQPAGPRPGGAPKAGGGGAPKAKGGGGGGAGKKK